MVASLCAWPKMLEYEVKYANFARQRLTKASYQVAKLGKAAAAGKSDANLMGQKIDYDFAAGKPTWHGILMAWLA